MKRFLSFFVISFLIITLLYGMENEEGPQSTNNAPSATTSQSKNKEAAAALSPRARIKNRALKTPFLFHCSQIPQELRDYLFSFLSTDDLKNAIKAFGVGADWHEELPGAFNPLLLELCQRSDLVIPRQASQGKILEVCDRLEPYL